MPDFSLARTCWLLAHGAYNLDELGIAGVVLVGVVVVGILAWIGGRREQREHEERKNG